MLIEFGNTKVKPDWHVDEYQATGYSRIYHILKGSVTYESEGTAETLRPGGVYVLPSSVPYRMRKAGEETLICTYMHINFLQARVTGLIQMIPEEDSCLGRYFATLYAAINENRIDLVGALAESLTFFIRDSRFFSQSSPMLNRVQEYIMSHLQDEICVGDLSRLFSYHPNYFIRLFRRETGYTPHEYIQQHRMQYAVSMLSRGMSNQVIAEACGYADPGTFTRAFRCYYGISPQKYATRFQNVYR